MKNKKTEPDESVVPPTQDELRDRLIETLPEGSGYTLEAILRAAAAAPKLARENVLLKKKMAKSLKSHMVAMGKMSQQNTVLKKQYADRARECVYEQDIINCIAVARSVKLWPVQTAKPKMTISVMGAVVHISDVSELLEAIRCCWRNSYPVDGALTRRAWIERDDAGVMGETK